MTQFDIRKRDGLARTGILETGTATVRLPSAVDAESLFPALANASSINIPLSAPAVLVQQFSPVIPGGPVIIHPQRENAAVSGDCVMAANWHTAFANPRNYVDWLVGLKEKTPADTVWYAPASALPSTVAILCYSGFELFDYTAVDLKSAQGRFCTPEGDFPSDAMETGICTCPGCKAGDLQEHNREALRQEIALVTRFIQHCAAPGTGGVPLPYGRSAGSNPAPPGSPLCVHGGAPACCPERGHAGKFR